MTPPSDPGSAEPSGPRSLRELFWAFTGLAMQGFGGVLPVAQRELVERRRWLTQTEFVELLSLSQLLPGPNIVNLGLMFGQRCLGWRGAWTAVAGLLALPSALVLVLAALTQSLQSVPGVAGALRGMGVVGAGLILATGLKSLKTLLKPRSGPAVPKAFILVTVALTVATVAVWRVPLVAALAVSVPLAWGMAYWLLARNVTP